MKRSPELKPRFWDGLVVLTVLALAAAAALTVWPSGSDNALTVVVTADGQELDRFAPAELAAGPRTYTHNCYTLTVTASEDGLRVSEADCPTQDCVHTGRISRAGQSIVCLPAQVAVQLVGAATPDAPDVIVG